MFGSLQHAPQLMHCPLRRFETGRMHVMVLLILARQVFPCSFTMPESIL